MSVCRVCGGPLPVALSTCSPCLTKIGNAIAARELLFGFKPIRTWKGSRDALEETLRGMR